MKKILMVLMLGISCLAFAAVAPETRPQMRRPKIIRPDMTKQRVMRQEKPKDDQVDEQAMKDMLRYRRTVTKDNVDALENMARLMQDDPGALFGRVSGQDVESKSANNNISTYKRTSPDATPEERLAVLEPPSIIDSIEGGRVSEEEIERLYQSAVQRVEQVGQTRLEQKQFGQKQAPITQVLTAEDVKNSGIDLRYLPENWEELLEESQAQSRQMRKQRLPAGQTSTVPGAQK